jgi:hypothetical protein
MNDEQLATDFRALASRWNCAPDVALKLLDSAMQQRANMGGSNFGPFPVKIEVCPFMSDRSDWPSWTQELIPPDSKFERHVFADGKQVAKLVTSRAIVLLATVIHVAKIGDNDGTPKKGTRNL